MCHQSVGCAQKGLAASAAQEAPLSQSVAILNDVRFGAVRATGPIRHLFVRGDYAEHKVDNARYICFTKGLDITQQFFYLLFYVITTLPLGWFHHTRFNVP